MGYRNWDQAIRDGTFEADCRRKRREQGFDPNLKPTHDWLHKNGFSGIQNYAERNDKTVDEVLLDQLGFREPTFDFGINHQKTERLVNEFITEETEVFETWNDTSVEGGKSALKRMAEFAREARGTDNLVDIAKEEKPVAREILLQIFDVMEDELDDGGCYNYGNSLKRFFDHLLDIGEIEHNPVPRILERKDYTPEREAPSEADAPGATDVRRLYETADPVLKVIIILLGAAGGRPTRIVGRTVGDLDLNPVDPKVYFGTENKTGPSANALMAGVDFLKAYCERQKQAQDGDTTYLFPSESGETPHLSYDAMLQMVKEHAAEVGVTRHDGDPITPKSLKQFYLIEQTEAHRIFLEQHIGQATDAVDDNISKIKDDHYIPDQKQRDHFRAYAESKFAVAFPHEVVKSGEIDEARAKAERKDNQTGLDEFGDL